MIKLEILRYFCFFAIFFIAYPSPSLASTLENIAASGTIKLGITENAEPFSYFYGDKPLGYSVDICLKVAEAIKLKIKRPDLTIQFIKLSYASRIPAMISKEIDIGCGVITNTADHMKRVDFTLTTFVSETRILVRKDSAIRSTIDLNNTRIVAAKNTTNEKILRDLITRTFMNITPIYSNSDADSFAIFEQKKADVIILDDILLYWYLTKDGNKDIFRVMPNPLSLRPISLMLRKEDYAFKIVVDTEVRRLMRQGEIVDIYRKWFESPIPPRQISLDYPMTDFIKEIFENPSDWPN